jgi:hypothetical protein
MASPHDYALVRHDGTILRQQGVVSVSHPRNGVYRLRFVDDVQAAAWQATLARTELGIGFDEPTAELIAVFPMRNPRMIEVRTKIYRLNTAGTFLDTPGMDSGFFLSVLR